MRHRLTSVLAIATCATLAGARSIAAIGEWANDLPQDVLRRLGAKHHPLRCCYIAPHDATFRRALAAIDTTAADDVVGAWLSEQVRAGRVAEAQLVLALDGKAVRGAPRDDGRAVHLFSAMVHGDGVVVAQSEVDDKSNEITASRPLLEGLDLGGALITADAMHTQRDHATFLVEEKNADYLFQVKANQPNLLEAVQAMGEGSFPPEVEDTPRGHGRIEHRYIRVTDAPQSMPFPHAAQVVVVYRERADLADFMVSAETSYYVTRPQQRQGRPRRGSPAMYAATWGIENRCSGPSSARTATRSCAASAPAGYLHAVGSRSPSKSSSALKSSSAPDDHAHDLSNHLPVTPKAYYHVACNSSGAVTQNPQATGHSL